MIKDQRSKAHLWASWPYQLIPILYLCAYFCIGYLQNPCIMLWVFYAIIPFFDDAIQPDQANPSPEESKYLAQQMKFKFPLYIGVFADWSFMIWVVDYILSNQLNIFDLLCIFFIASSLGGSNINVAHELVHKDNKIDKFLGTYTLARNLYMHFNIEHIFGHHRMVATPNDPATSKKGQSVYQFWVQTVIGSYKSAWRFECQRIRKIYGKLNPFCLQNRLIQYNIIYVVLTYLFYLWRGFGGAILFLLLGCVSSLFLETVNYVEHYGLERKLIQKGVYEPVDIRHSWNAPHRFSNYLLFKLQRHSDHHENPDKPYQTLCTFDDSPCLPHGYPVCIILALFPKQWFRIIDKHLQNYQLKEKSDSEAVKYVENQIKNFVLGLVISLTAAVIGKQILQVYFR